MNIHSALAVHELLDSHFSRISKYLKPQNTHRIGDKGKMTPFLYLLTVDPKNIWPMEEYELKDTINSISKNPDFSLDKQFEIAKKLPKETQNNVFAGVKRYCKEDLFARIVNLNDYCKESIAK